MRPYQLSLVGPGLNLHRVRWAFAAALLCFVSACSGDDDAASSQGSGGASSTSASGTPSSTSSATGGNGGGAGFSLRFHGNGVNDIDRVKIPIDIPPPDSSSGPPADVGAQDFTLEFWMRGDIAENTAGAIGCGDNIDWIYGNIIFDRDRYSQDRKFGLSLGGGTLVFGVSGQNSGDHTICGTQNVLDGAWHHVAVQRRRSDGRMWLFVDGTIESEEAGPTGDISYPDDGIPGDFCNGPCTNSDPFLVIGAEKHDAGAQFPSYSGFIDEVRISNVLRYMASFQPSTTPFVTDANTVALYHLDEGQGDMIMDTSDAPGGPSNGVRRYGGNPEGPEWSTETPF